MSEMERVQPMSEDRNWDYNVNGMPMVNPIKYDTYQITINKLDKGLIVSVGCKSFAFEDIDIAMKYVAEYLHDPQGVSEKFENKTLFI